jgi:predicted small secreted protein
MMKAAIAIAVIVALAAPPLLAGCDHPKGPAERAGEQIDKAKEKIDDAVDPKGPAEKAGRKVDKALGN